MCCVGSITKGGEAAQGKLVWVSSGTVFDVIVDLRESSPTYGVWDGYMLTTDAHERLYVPPGCAHGFLVVSDITANKFLNGLS